MVLYFRSFLIILSLFYFSKGYSQSEINPDKIKKTKSKELIFFWPGIDCPSFKNTYDLYGFKIACSGSTDTRKINKNNKKVVKIINHIYGKDWFDQNINLFIINDKARLNDISFDK